jgi:hypothetical protein
MIGDCQRITILAVAKQKLAFVIGAPEFVGSLTGRQSGSLCPSSCASATLDQAVAIQHSMNRALGRNRDARESAAQAFANFASTPARVLVFHVQNIILHLEGKLIGVAIGPTTSIGQTLNIALLIAIKDLIASLARDPELAAKLGQRLAR